MRKEKNELLFCLKLFHCTQIYTSKQKNTNALESIVHLPFFLFIFHSKIVFISNFTIYNPNVLNKYQTLNSHMILLEIDNHSSIVLIHLEFSILLLIQLNIDMKHDH